jgi:mevalonate kinase
MNKQGKIFYSKILLFGEYSVIFNSMGLSIPYSHFKGELDFINQDKYTDLTFAHESNRLIHSFADHLRKLISQKDLGVPFNISRLFRDLEKGLFFESTIPQGFGLGSSGALVAALYDMYAEEKMRNLKRLGKSHIKKLKETFSQLESYFHGTSSGLDPLNCYIKSPLLIRNKSDIQVVDLPGARNLGEGSIFLIDTGKPRKTGPLVDMFLERAHNDEQFYRSIHDQFIPATNNCITSLMNGEIQNFFGHLYQLSSYQYEFMTTMIPEAFRDIWKKGIDTGDFNLKLCGSGGGGFLLGFARNYDEIKEEFLRRSIQPIPVLNPGKI